MSADDRKKPGRKAMPIKATFIKADGTPLVLRFADEASRDREHERLRIRGDLKDGVEWQSFEDVAQRVIDNDRSKRADGAPDSYPVREIRKVLIPLYGKLSVRAVTVDVIDALRTEICDTRGKIPWNNTQGALKSIVTVALSRGWILTGDDPFLTLPSYRAETTQLIARQTANLVPLSLPTLLQINEILDRSEGWLRTAVHLVLYAGLRTGELRALKWEHIEIDDENLIVWVNVRDAVKADETVGPPKSKKGIRDICVEGPLYELLKNLHPGPDKLETFVATPDGEMLKKDRFYIDLRYFQARIGIGGFAKRDRGPSSALTGVFGPHMLRHAAVAWWIWKRVPDAIIKYWVGHASLTTTLDIYGYIFKAETSGVKFWPAGEVPSGNEADEGEYVE